MRLLVVVTVLGAHLCASLARGDEPPNFVLINIDDLGYAEIGPFGSKVNSTPNLDRMAAEGRKLTSHYAATLCSPSRASLMTGCYPKRSLPIPHVLWPKGAVGLHPDEITIAEVLKGAGYSTACIGKWHLGDQPEFLPTRQGFDYFFGLPYSNDMGPIADGAKSNLGRPKPKPDPSDQIFDQYGIRGSHQPPIPILENEHVVGRMREAEQQSITNTYTERAVQYIRDHKDERFFLYVPHTAVHFPFYPGSEFVDSTQKRLRGDWVEEVDWSVGQILDAIRESGLEENTFVLFTSDNGGPVKQNGDNSPFRGGKTQTLEGGVRVCTIAWWPGHIPAGTSTDAITSMMDVLPTFAKLAGTQAPTDRQIDGMDIWPILIGDAELRETFYYYRGLQLEAVRQGPWKLHLRDGELYQLDEDPGESSNVAAAHPEVVSQIRALAEDMRGDLGIDMVGPGCRPLGLVEDPRPLIDFDGTVREGFQALQGQFP